PSVRLPEPELEAQAAAMDKKIGVAQVELRKVESKLAPGLATWERTAPSAEPKWHRLRPLRMSSDRGVTFDVQGDGSVLVSGAHPDKDIYTITAETDLTNITAFRLELLPDATMPGGGSGRGAGGKSVLTLFEARMAPLGGGPEKT